MDDAGTAGKKNRDRNLSKSYNFQANFKQTSLCACAERVFKLSAPIESIFYKRYESKGGARTVREIYESTSSHVRESCVARKP